MKIKRNLIQLSLLALPLAVQAQLSYSVNGDGVTATITGYNTAAGLNVVIPDTTNGYPVTTIGEQAFFNSTITNVTIGTNVTSIGQYAFVACSSLTSVTIPDSVTSIGDGVFENCTSLMSVTIGNGVTSIGNFAFAHCTSLTGVTIPDSVTTIEYDAFSQCSGLTSVTIGTSVTSIGQDAFGYCSSLTNIFVSVSNPAYSSLNGVLFDKSQANLLEFPDGLHGSYTIPNSVTNIWQDAFFDCTSLTGVTIPNSVTSINQGAFAYCTSLTGVTIPNSVTSIGFGAFESCTSLTNVIAGSGITALNNGYEFYGCTNLMSIYCRGNAPNVQTASQLFSGDNEATVYYLSGTTGWEPTLAGLPTALWNPQAQKDASFGVQNNQFGFNITGAANLVIVVEACTNLSNPVWTPVSTNTLTGGTSYFSDPQWTNYPARFYRLRSP